MPGEARTAKGYTAVLAKAVPNEGSLAEIPDVRDKSKSTHKATPSRSRFSKSHQACCEASCPFGFGSICVLTCLYQTRS